MVDSTGFDDLIEFSDADETVFSCRAPAGELATFSGKEIGTKPVSCGAWAPTAASVAAGSARLAELDELIARSEARHKRRSE